MIDATGLLRLYARYRSARLAAQDAVETQRRLLRRLVRRAAKTRFGRDHRFQEIADIEDFQARVPLRRYEQMWRDYWQPTFPRLVDCTWPGTIPFFALTSGTTTGATKYIPCSREMNRSNEWAAIDILVHHLRNRPRSRVLGGKNFMLGGSTDLTEQSPGIRSGDLSGIAVSQVPWWAWPYCFPPPELALIADWEHKIERLATACLGQDIRTITGTPSWLLIFFERLFAMRPEWSGRLHRFFPDLELLVHGGVNFAPYRQRFEELLAGSHAELREVYPASEGFFAVADRGPSEGMRLILDNGIFYEFVPVEELETSAPTRHWLGTVRPGVTYALVVSSCAGLWAYVVGDTVRLVDLDPPRILVAGRTSYFLSAFGEHLSGEEIEAAVAAAARSIGCTIADFSVGPVFPDAAQHLGRHLYVVEFGGRGPSDEQLHAFALALDARLCHDNDDYRAHRSGGFGLDAPEVLRVPHGAFSAWMRSRGQLGGQHKVPRVVADPALFRELRDFVGTLR
ncbi:MAG TPA: GH3 auxin-responsive promoter family protein [Stellaceae bacterium]|nr:GH3 auxin-responsive promoter family protein [Stellaceae bacterium]